MEHAPTAGSFRIGTWNVEYASLAKNGRRLEIMHAANADIWVLTETRDELDLGSGYTAVSSAPRDLDRLVATARWVTIWSRFPLLTPIEVRDTSRTVAGLYETPLGPLLVYETVMPWHTDKDPSDTKDWAKHERVVPEQAHEWLALAQRHSRAAVCIAGDLNMNLGGPHYYGTKQGQRLLPSGMDGAKLTCVTRTEHVPPGLLDKPHIDHVLLPESWAQRARVVGAWPGTIGGVRLSDHSGIVVEVSAEGEDTTAPERAGKALES